MLFLLAASLMWAFSFGLIKGHLVAYDPVAVAWVRLAISGVFFLPWLMRNSLSKRFALGSMGLGAVQFGLMYCFYIASYQNLPAYAVALFTIFTPLYVVGISDLLARRWVPRHTVAALLAVSGAALVTLLTFDSADALLGIGLLQLSNLCFAAGQVGYRHLVAQVRGQVPEAALLGWMYLGAALVTALAALLFTDRSRVGFDQDAILVLLYLGLVPTGLGFYLWNKGAVRVGSGVLAASNNLKIPLAVLCSWLIFSESAAYPRVLGGLAIIVAALFLAGGGRPEKESTYRIE